MSEEARKAAREKAWYEENRKKSMKCERNVITKPENFVFIPTGHFLGEINGLTGYWDGRRNAKNAPVITFPEGELPLGSEFVTMYEPTETEIDMAIAERKESGKGEYDQKQIFRTAVETAEG